MAVKPRKETLKEQLARETERRKRLQLGLQDLRAYAMSPKFSAGDQGMNHADVILRVNETLAHAAEMELGQTETDNAKHN